MLNRHTSRAVGIMQAFALLAVACGGSDGGDSSAAGNETASSSEAAGGVACGLGNGEQATGTPIPVGGIVGETGPDDFSSAGDAAAAYFACINANGGINGRPVDYILEDDQWNPEVAGQVAARLVQDEGVVALIGGASFVECGVNAELYASEGVISLLGVGVPRQCFESSNLIPINEGPRLSSLGVAQYAADELAATSFTCVALQIPGLGDWVCDGIQEWAEGEGLTSVTQLIDPTLPDPNAVALDAIGSGSDALVLSLPAGAATAVLAAAEQQDARDDALWIGPTSLYDADFPEAVGAYWDGAITAQIELAVLDSTDPDNQEWLAVMDAFGADEDPRDSFSQAGFLSAKFFTEALLAVDDPDSIDRAAATAAILAIQTESDLLCGPWYAGVADEHNANHAGRVVVVDGDDFNPVAPCTEVIDSGLANVLAAEAELGIGG